MKSLPTWDQFWANFMDQMGTVLVLSVQSIFLWWFWPSPQLFRRSFFECTAFGLQPESWTIQFLRPIYLIHAHLELSQNRLYPKRIFGSIGKIWEQDKVKPVDLFLNTQVPKSVSSLFCLSAVFCGFRSPSVCGTADCYRWRILSHQPRKQKMLVTSIFFNG